MLRTVFIAAMSMALVASAAGQQAKSGPAKGSTSESEAAAGKKAGTNGSTSGTSYTGPAPSLTTSIPPIPTPELKVIEPAKITPAPYANIVAARPTGAGGGCSRKSTSECGVEAATCLGSKGLEGNHTVDSVATAPSIRQTYSRTEDQARAAGECAAELQACLQPGC